MPQQAANHRSYLSSLDRKEAATPLAKSIARPARDSHRTIFDARQRLTSTTGTRASYDLEMLREYALSRKSSALGMTVLLVLMGVFASFWVPLYAVSLWVGMVVLTNLVVVAICARFLKDATQKTTVRRWTASFIAGETVYGIAWAMLALFTLASGDNELAVVIFVILLIGLGANAMASRSLLVATLMTTLPATFTVSINLFMFSGHLYNSLAAVAIVAQVFVLLFLRRLQKFELDS
ncbi:MAG: hypothetical protein L3J13_04345, partial [Devosiaceae bacterium]|nr:hypothetical protein [Devosiaceae bacterium]